MRYTRHELKQDHLPRPAEAVHEVVEHRSGIIRIVADCCGARTARRRHLLVHDSRKSRRRMRWDRPWSPITLRWCPGHAKEGSMTTFNSDQERPIASKNAFYAISDHYGWTRSGQYARYLAG